MSARVVVSILAAVFPGLIAWLGGADMLQRGFPLAFSTGTGVFVGLMTYVAPMWPRADK